MKSLHFSTMLAASIMVDNSFTNINPNDTYSNVTRFDVSAVHSFCNMNKTHTPLKIAINSTIGDYIAIKQK
jgi:hypothetical protein